MDQHHKRNFLYQDYSQMPAYRKRPAGLCFNRLFILCGMVLIAACSTTGNVSDYSWDKSVPGVFGGKTFFQIMETPASELDISYLKIQDYLDFFDYPGSRMDVKKEYIYKCVPVIHRPVRPGSGINLNGLDAPNEGEWGSVIKEGFFAQIREAGFDILRLPVRFSNHLDNTKPSTLNPAFMERVDWAIDNALKKGLTVVLENHIPDNGLRAFASPEEEEANIELFLETWKSIAERYRDYPPTLYFEIMNEPHLPYSIDIWNRLNLRAVDIIRSSGGDNKNRTIVIGCGTWSHVGALKYLVIPSVEEDPNIIVTFHYYEPYSFTHQGATWGGWQQISGFWKGNVWTGTDYQKSLIQKDFDIAAAWANKNGRRIFLGEFGTTSFADKQSRVRFTEYVRQQAEERGFTWACWSFNAADAFGIYDAAGGWKVELLDALIPPQRD